MNESEPAELVPDTPKHVQYEDSASQSLLRAYVHPPPASFSGPSLEHSSTDFASQVPSAHLREQQSRSQRPRSPPGENDSGLDIVGVGVISTVCDSQMPPRHPPTPPQHHVPVPRARRASGETFLSHSQPTEGPSAMEGYLPETQAQSLTMASGMSERQRRDLKIRGEGGRGGTDDPAGLTRRDEEVSMELTRAEGRVLQEDKIDAKSPSAEKEDEERQRTPTAQSQPESQKENPPASRPASIPGSNGAPFSLRNSQAATDEAAAPSSSGIVANELLQRSSPRKPNSTSVDESTSMSSADPPIPLGQLFSPERRPRALADTPGTAKQSVSGPETSTPFVANVPPPHPLTFQRTTPNVMYQSQTSSHSASPRAAPTRSAPVLSLRPTTSRPADFATSDAMKAPPPKKKQKRDVFDSLSSQSDHSLREPTQEASLVMAQTIVHDEEEQNDTDDRRQQALPKPTAERTMDMDIDDGSDPLDQSYGGVHKGNLFRESLNESLGNSMGTSPALAELAVQQEDSLDLPVGSRSGVEPVTSPSSERSLSRQNSQASSVKKGARGKRLSDIADIDGSSPAPSQSLYVPPGTQHEYDALSHTMSNSNSHPLSHGTARSVPTQDISFNNGQDWHASFVNPDVSQSHSRDTTSTSLVSANRALRRDPPPPTPVRDGVMGANPLNHPRSPPRPNNHDSLPLDPTQLEDPTQLDDASDVTALSARRSQLRAVLPRPTQSVPESSPEVPLARKRPFERSSLSIVEHQDQLRLSPVKSSSGVGRPEPSSNGVVPDSEGPTQDAPGDESLPAAPVASSSKARPPLAVSERDEQGSARAFYRQKDYGGGTEGHDQEMENAEEGPGEEAEEGQFEKDELDDFSPLPQVPTKSSKGKGRAKPAPPAKPVKKVVPTVKKAAASSARTKGKGRALQAEESPDVLDLLSTAALSSSRRRSADNIAGAAVEETNYSDLPSTKNTKKRSPTKAVPTTKGKGKRPKRASTACSDFEQEGSETEREDEAEKAPRRKRRRSSTVSEDEQDEDEQEEERPRKGRRPSADKAAATKPNSSKRGKVVKAVAIKEKKAGRGRRARTVEAGSASPSPEPAPPVRGPSRLRFQSVDDEIPAGAVSPATTEGRSNSFGSAKGKSRLPDTAPFSRVWGKWRDDGFFYAGTVVAVSGSRFHVHFDDGSKGKLLPDELRRCELQEGDIVRYVGDEEADTETQVVTLKADVQVIRVERKETGEDAHGELEADDIIVAASTTHVEGRVTRLLVAAVSIPANHGQQFDDRKLTADEMAAFGFRERQKPAEPLALAKPPKPIRVNHFAPSKNTTGRFYRTAFLITGSSYDKPKLAESMQTHGATILEWEHLFEVNTVHDSTSPPELFWPKVDFKSIDQIFLLADKPSTTVKYLVALGLGVPCLSKEFAVDSMAQTARIDWRPYALAAGFIRQLNTQALGSQLHAISKNSFDLDSLQVRHEQGGVFKGRSFLIVSGEKASGRGAGGGGEEGKRAKPTKDEQLALQRRLYQYLSLLSTASASLVHFVSSPSDASAGQGYDHVFLDGDFRVPKALAGHKGLVNITWVKQCLMAGRLLPSARMKEAEEK
ncbi:hypothetical protein JCM11251_004343 [Rhodosporidiobolus azoricus]